jgi:hypothetical protein
VVLQSLNWYHYADCADSSGLLSEHHLLQKTSKYRLSFSANYDAVEDTLSVLA